MHLCAHTQNDDITHPVCFFQKVKQAQTACHEMQHKTSVLNDNNQTGEKYILNTAQKQKRRDSDGDKMMT